MRSLLICLLIRFIIPDNCIDMYNVIGYNKKYETEATRVKIVGERLRILREGVKLSQVKIAKLIGSTQSSINRYECDIGNPPYPVLLWYADYFDVSLDYIFGRTDQPQGKLYDFKPRISDNDDMRLFIEMCFDPNSPKSGKLKDTLLQMMKGGEKNGWEQQDKGF